MPPIIWMTPTLFDNAPAAPVASAPWSSPICHHLPAQHNQGGFLGENMVQTYMVRMMADLVCRKEDYDEHKYKRHCENPTFAPAATVCVHLFAHGDPIRPI